MEPNLEDMLLDELVVALYRISLAPRASCRNIISVYSIDEPNEFHGRYEPIFKHLGFVHVQGYDTIFVKKPPLHAPHTHIEIADPELFAKMFKFFGICEHRIEHYKQTWPIAPITLDGKM